MFLKISINIDRDVCSSLVAHLAAVAATRIPASCQILYLQKVKTQDGEWTLLNPGNKKSYKKKHLKNIVTKNESSSTMFMTFLNYD